MGFLARILLWIGNITDTGPSIPDWGAPLVDFFTWSRKIMGVGYSGVLTRYAAIRFVHLVEGCDLSKALFLVRSFLKTIKRMNYATKKLPVTVELLSWVKGNFANLGRLRIYSCVLPSRLGFSLDYAFLRLKTSVIAI